jgi:ATP-dependent Clp protease adaptor protein ClpS
MVVSMSPPSAALPFPGAGPFRKPQNRYIPAQDRRTPNPHEANLAHLSHIMTDKDRGSGQGPGHETGLLTKTKTRTQRPPLYKVMLLNDDYTPMEFVVHILERFFGLNHAQAFEIMLTVHKKGLAVVGVFSFEIAETKVAQVMDFARRHQHPLQCTMEKE